MDTNKWGPHAWFFIHTIAINYPITPTSMEKQYHREFFTSLGDILPCPVCRVHFKQNSSNLDSALASKTDLFKYTIDVHNKVNKSNNKPIWSYDRALAYYTHIYLDSSEPWFLSDKFVLFLIIILGVVIVVKKSCIFNNVG
uniref:Sulfhydryl oxidase n=1 Tax=Megaviridae environmental sample TaxID=1737588 RepID=A0A5J6VJI4_9VIRU|nr:MAG: Erv1 / Alr family protein [Megaviridae environmental sample]